MFNRTVTPIYHPVPDGDRDLGRRRDWLKTVPEIKPTVSERKQADVELPSVPGRNCPLHYRCYPEDLARDPDIEAQTLYVIGGLYGNDLALAELNRLAATEPQPVRFVFNGDFNWFNAEPDWFRSLNDQVLTHPAIRGNVEHEIATPGDDSGCGCAYPEWVDDGTVKRSNRMLQRLQTVAQPYPRLRELLRLLPFTLVAAVGDVRVAVVHGDAESLAGWGFARESLSTPENVARIMQWFRQSAVNVFASTHTCAPVCRSFSAFGKHRVLINNGAAGMPNFANTQFGLVSRISTQACELKERLYGTRIGDVHVDAIAVHYNHEAWWKRFTSVWSTGSLADRSYGARIRCGTSLPLATLQAEAAG